MFEPVPMTRLRLVILERDERAVLRHVGRAGVLQLTRTPAGPDTAPLSPRDRNAELLRLEHLSARLKNLRRSLAPPAAKPPAAPGEMSLEQAGRQLQSFEAQTGELLQRRQRLQERCAEMADLSGRISNFQAVELPLDRPAESAFLHFVTGSLPAQNFAGLEAAADTLLVPLAERQGRQVLLAFTTRQNRPALDRALQAAGFTPETLPVVAGATTAALAAQNRREQQLAAAELNALNASLKILADTFAPAWTQMETALDLERRLLAAEQNFPRTESSLLLTGWLPSADVPALEQRLHELTRGCIIFGATPAEALPAEEIPVLLRPPRWLRPFALLVSAYGLPRYRELEPTLFVAVSYLLMFGMMFGDVGHGLTFACGGLAIWWRSRRPQLRDIALLLLFCGLSSMVFGALYGSYFGLPGLKQYALWHDPLEGNPLGFMSTAIAIGFVLMSLGLVLNVINHFRRGQFLRGCLDKFGLAGILFYWGALALLLKYAAIRARGLGALAVLIFIVIPLLGWTLKEPLEFLRRRRSAPPPAPAHQTRTADPAGSLAGSFLESLVEVFEGLMSYLSNTVSFVRLAAYAMSHSALLLAAFIMAEQVRHVPAAGGLLGALVIILGNLVAIILEGIIAAVQALRLEYYEFFSKFYSGNGQPFQPFCLDSPAEPATG